MKKDPIKTHDLKGDKDGTTFVQSKGTDYQSGTIKEHNVMSIHEVSNDWSDQFLAMFESKVTAYHNGIQDPKTMFTMEEEDFLRSLGVTPQEIFDFVEDWVEDGVPDPKTVLAITKIRRDYFYNEQKGQPSDAIRSEHDFPSRTATLAGLKWFPRIIEKAKAKLRGELPPDLMYSCGGDRRFLKAVNIHPAEFLQKVWDAGDNVEEIVTFVTDRAKR